MRSLFLSALLLILPAPLFADTVYTYTGNDFTFTDTSSFTTSNFVSGSFTTASPLAPNLNQNGQFTPATELSVISFSFSNGNQTVTNTNSADSSLPGEAGIWVETDSSGNLVGWLIQLAVVGNAGNGPFSYIAVQTDNWYNNGYAPGNQDIFSSDFGQIPTVVFGENETLGAGTGHDPGTWSVSSTDLVSSPVPEPSSLALLGTGVLGTFCTLRRRFLN